MQYHATEILIKSVEVCGMQCYHDFEILRRKKTQTTLERLVSQKTVKKTTVEHY